MKKSLVLMAGAVMTVAMLGGCGRSMKDVSGDYSAKMKMMDLLSEEDAESFEELEEQGMGFFKDLDLTMNLELNEDGSYTLAADVDQMKEDITDGFNDNAESIVMTILDNQGVTEDQYQTLAESAGYEDFDGFMGYMIDMMGEAIDEAMVEFEDSADEFSADGEYKLKGDKITLMAFDEDGDDCEGTFGDDNSFSVTINEGDDNEMDLKFAR